MPRGGSRKHPPDCKCGNCPKLGRPKTERPTTNIVAHRVLAQVKAEKLWNALVSLECRRLGIDKNGELVGLKKKQGLEDGVLEQSDGVIDGPDYQGRFSIIPLTNLLRYLEDRAYGRPMDTVNHLHDKPLEVNATLTLGEGMRIAMEKAEARVSKRG